MEAKYKVWKGSSIYTNYWYYAQLKRYEVKDCDNLRYGNQLLKTGCTGLVYIIILYIQYTLYSVLITQNIHNRRRLY